MMRTGGIGALRARDRGLALPVATPPYASGTPVEAPTEEAAICAPPGRPPRIEMLAAEGEVLAEGAPVARLRHDPEVLFVAPMAARVAQVRLLPGHRLGEIVLFRETGGTPVRHPGAAAAAASAEGLARLLLRAGFWPRLRRRPYGTMPGPGERPAAVVVMACDTTPLAPDPRLDVAGREESLARGLEALSLLAAGPVLLCQDADRPVLPPRSLTPPVRGVPVGRRHPQGLAGLRVHDLCPATDARPVWDLHAGDVADLGCLLQDGRLPQTRVVSVAGPALSESRLLRCQIGADARGLSYGAIRPGPHRILVGSPLDGRPAQWLGPRDRQVTVLPGAPPAAAPHWFLSALGRSSRPPPIVPTAALTQAAGGAFPVMALLRALSTGDDETATRLGALSLVEEDLALVDYVTGGTPAARDLLRAYLDRARAEAAA